MRVLPLLLVLLCCIAVASAIRCYVCNSLMNPDCENNFEKDPKLQMGCPQKNILGKKSVKAIGCRVSRQNINNEQSIVRECAYVGNNVEGKSQKGSLGVSRTMTQCDTDLCNPGSSISFSVVALVSLLIFRL